MYGAEGADGHWRGWIAFFPMGEGPAVCTPQESSQPTREMLEYWAKGLSATYLEGAFARAVAAQPQVVIEKIRARLEEDAALAREEARWLDEAADAKRRTAEAAEAIRSELDTRH